MNHNALTETPTATVEITPAVVRSLVDTQFPQWAEFPLTFASEGWDNVTYRLGGSLAIRLPRREATLATVAAEHEWLPRISRTWTFAVPAPVALGAPGGDYPWPWSVVPWIDGSLAMDAPLSAEGAADLGSALAQIHTAAHADSPHNRWRSLPLSGRAEQFTSRLAVLATSTEHALDDDAVRHIVEAAEPRGGLTWCHLDLHGRNLVTQDGRLAGILDWGDSAAGDPCTDLGQALYLLGTSNFEQCAAAYAAAGGAGDPHAKRVRAEALTYAVTMATLDDHVYRASGWRALVDLGVARAA